MLLSDVREEARGACGLAVAAGPLGFREDEAAHRAGHRHEAQAAFLLEPGILALFKGPAGGEDALGKAADEDRGEFEAL